MNICLHKRCCHLSWLSLRHLISLLLFEVTKLTMLSRYIQAVIDILILQYLAVESKLLFTVTYFKTLRQYHSYLLSWHVYLLVSIINLVPFPKMIFLTPDSVTLCMALRQKLVGCIWKRKKSVSIFFIIFEKAAFCKL